VGDGDAEGEGDGDGDGVGLGAGGVGWARWVAVTVVAVGEVPFAVSMKTIRPTAAATAIPTAPMTATAVRKLVSSIRARSTRRSPSPRFTR
jgi:hypothetical protein